MTDNDAQLLRAIISRNTFAKVCRELGRILGAYAEQQPHYYPAKKAMTRFIFILEGRHRGI